MKKGTGKGVLIAFLFRHSKKKPFMVKRFDPPPVPPPLYLPWDCLSIWLKALQTL